MTSLSDSRRVTRIARGWRRAAPPAPIARSFRSEIGNEQEAFEIFLHSFVPKLFSLWHWRHALLVHEDIPYKVPSVEADAFGCPLAEALEALLEPWFLDEAALDYERFHRLLLWLSNLTPLPSGTPMRKRTTKKRPRRK